MKLSLIIFIMIGHFDSNISAGPPVGVRVTAQNLQLSQTPPFSKQINHFLDYLQFDLFGIKQKLIDPIPIEKRQLNES